jgi:hypothetical protein
MTFCCSKCCKKNENEPILVLNEDEFSSPLGEETYLNTSNLITHRDEEVNNIDPDTNTQKTCAIIMGSTAFLYAISVIWAYFCVY